MSKADQVRFFAAERCSAAEIAAHLRMSRDSVVQILRNGGTWPKHAPRALQRNRSALRLVAGLAW